MARTPKQAPSPQPTTTRTRDPQRTQERILAAALKEFAAKGFSGARVDAIARRAGVNKRMLYIYFGDKEALLREIMRRQFARQNPLVLAAPDDPAEALPYWHELARGGTDWIRLLQWEALRTGSRRVVCEEERRDAYAHTSDKLREAQEKGFLSSNLEPEQVLLAMLALSVYPVAFPQVVRLVTGLAPTDPRFEEKWLDFLHRFAEHLRRPSAVPVAPPPETVELPPQRLGPRNGNSRKSTVDAS